MTMPGCNSNETKKSFLITFLISITITTTQYKDKMYIYFFSQVGKHTPISVIHSPISFSKPPLLLLVAQSPASSQHQTTT